MSAQFLPLAELPTVVKKRLDLYTAADARQFSTNVIELARQNYPHSNAYKLGDVSGESSGFLGNTVNTRHDVCQVPNPANVFRLHWHKTMLKVEGDPESAPSDAETARLSRLHAVESLRMIKKIVATNQNYKKIHERFPHLEKLEQLPL